MKSRVFSAFLAGIFTLAGTATAAERYVPSGYSTIQAAINACGNGDVVIIAPGTYTGTGNRDIDFLGKAITVRSIDPDDPCVVANTIIDGGNERPHYGFYFQAGEGLNSILAGLTIKRFSHYWGAGIRCNGASPVIRKCVIVDNTADNTSLEEDLACGGGIAAINGSGPMITNCHIERNSARGSVTDTLSTDADGGGVYGDGTSTVKLYNCTIADNTAKGGQGYVTAGPYVDIYPYYSKGGGLYINNGTINNCIIAGNAAYPVYGEDNSGGSGGYWRQSVGAGLYASSATVITNCTITGNNGQPEGHGPANGGGIYGNAQVTNCIIWANIASNQIQSNSNVTYSDVQGGYTGTGNINADPCFIAGPPGNYYLSQIAAGQSADSPCIDAGSDLASYLGLIGYSTATNRAPDIDIADLGYHYPIPDMCRRADLKIDSSNIINFKDLAVFASKWLNKSCSDTNNWCGGTDFGYDGIVGEEDLYFMSTCWLETLTPDTTAPTPAPVFIISPDINYVSSEDHNTSGQFQFMDFPVDYRWWHKIVVDTSGIADNITPTEDLEVRFICLSNSSFNSTNKVPIPLTLGLTDGVLGSRANRWRVTIIGDTIIYDVDVDTYAATGRTLNWKVCVYDAAGNSVCTAMHTLGPPNM